MKQHSPHRLAFAERVLQTIWLLLFYGLAAQASEPITAPEYPHSDERCKADILLVVAHPDDDTAIAGYLARAIFDEHRRVAVIYTTRGDAGDDAVGSALGPALGAEREIEARQGMGFLGVTNVWFLEHAYDTHSENALRSLENMDHGSILGQVVRLVRLTRPEVIVAWLPLPVAGENHSDHQAASVIASEAFDLAGDPSAFAEQLGSADDASVGRDPEGLDPWQPKKIYYFSDAFDAAGYWQYEQLLPSPYRGNFLDGVGPAYSNTDVSPEKKVSYARLSAEETSFYLTQEGGLGKEALARGDFKAFAAPSRFVLGKSLVGGSVTGDVFEGITASPITFVRPPGVPAETHHGAVSLEPGGPWEFYRDFWKAHALERLADLLPIPEVSIGRGDSIALPLVIRNDTGATQNVTLRAVLPDGWVENSRYSVFPLPANSAYPVNRALSVPATSKPGWYEVTWKAEAGGRQSGEITWRVYVVAAGAV